MDQSILVTGANGQLGKCIRDIAPLYPRIRFYFVDRQVFPLEQYDLVSQKIKLLNPGIVINTAAYTAVDKAETASSLAFGVNADAVGHLATCCKSVGSRLFHISTDYVFDGKGKMPYKEEDKVSPVNQYGASKLKGEQLALEADPSATIIRTSWVYSRHGNNFVKTMIRLMKERPVIGVVNDQVGCPTYANDLAEALMIMAESKKPGGGIYHYSNGGPVTWFEFAMAIKSITGSDCVINPITTADFPTPAKRPGYSVMSNKKLEADFGIVQKPWKDRLRLCLAQLMETH